MLVASTVRATAYVGTWRCYVQDDNTSTSVRGSDSDPASLFSADGWSNKQDGHSADDRQDGEGDAEFTEGGHNSRQEGAKSTFTPRPLDTV